jgi:hypothetical protein
LYGSGERLPELGEETRERGPLARGEGADQARLMVEELPDGGLTR